MLTALDLCGSPRCTAPTTSGIHVAGGSSVLQLPASAGCQHAVPSLGEIRTILSGSWLMVCGSSNSRIQFLHYANSILAGSVDFLWPPSWSEDESPNWNAMSPAAQRAMSLEPREVLEVAAGGAAAGAPSRLPAARPHPVDKLLEAGGHGRGPSSDDADLSPLDGSLT